MIVQLLLILSIYHEGLLKENLSFSITKGCVLLCVLDTLVLVSFCVFVRNRGLVGLSCKSGRIFFVIVLSGITKSDS